MSAPGEPHVGPKNLAISLIEGYNISRHFAGHFNAFLYFKYSKSKFSPNWEKVIFVSGDVKRARSQTFTWTNFGPVQWIVYVWLDLNEFMKWDVLFQYIRLKKVADPGVYHETKYKINRI